MTEREFLERVERELRCAALDLGHALDAPNAAGRVLHAPPSVDCQRCRLDRVADEAADRAARL